MRTTTRGAARVRLSLAVLAVASFCLVVAPSSHAGAATPRVPVILDSDMYSSADDAGAEATLFAFDLMGQDNVIALGTNTRYDRPTVATNSWKCMAAIAQFYGYPNVPIGSDMPDNGPPPPSDSDFITPCAAYASPNTPAPQSAVEVYRKALAAEPNDSVVIVCTGYEENIDNLLNSSGDSYSHLDGSALVAQKVKELDLMGGGYPSRDGENNFEGDAGAASDVAANWPTKVVYSGYEVGSNVITGETVTATHPTDSPVRAALDEFAGPSHPIMSYDITAAYHAIDPSDTSLSEVGPGTNVIDNVGDNTFTAGTGDEYYLALSDVSGLESSIESLWDTLPGTTAQSLSFTSSPSSPIVGGTYGPTYSSGQTGNPVTLTIVPSSTSGCTISSSNTVTFSAPSGTCIVEANEPGDLTYAPATKSQTINVAGDPQTISFTSTPPDAAEVGGTYKASAHGGGSENPVVLSIDASSTAGCTINGSGEVTFSAPDGTCVIDANEAGNGTYAAAAQAQQLVGVGGDPQAVTFTSTPPSPARVGGTHYAPAATATSTLGVAIVLDHASTGCSLKGGVITFIAVGTCLVDATQAGNATYASAMKQQSIPVERGFSVITITSGTPNALAGRTYAPSARTNTGDNVNIRLGANSSGCGMAQGAVLFRAVGTCVIHFTDPGNANYAPSMQVQRLAIAKGHVRLTASVTPASAAAGALVSFRASVSVVFATGTVGFMVGGNPICSGPVRGGSAACHATVKLPKGGYKVIATYSGSSSFVAARAATTLHVH